MSDNTNPSWMTKYGPRRVRREAPTLDEAIAAARDLSDRLVDQAEIAASLMGAPREQVMAELLKTARQAKNVNTVFTTRAGAPRAVIVERKLSRRVAPGDRAAFVRKLNAGR